MDVHENELWAMEVNVLSDNEDRNPAQGERSCNVSANNSNRKIRARVRSRTCILTDQWLRILQVALAITIGLSWNASADEKITYRLKWLINMSTVGDVMAETQGFFKSQGLDVSLKEGGPERDAIREIELGHAEFGAASADQVIQAVAKGAPVVVVAQLFQANPLQWIYFKERNQINSPGDLKNKTIGVTFGKNDEIIMRTLLARAGISEKQVQLYSVRMDYTPFYKKQVDLWPVYINTQAVEIGRKITASGESVGFLNPEDYGVRFVANSVITSKRLLAEKPELVRRFLKALLKGWQEAIAAANSDLALDAVRRYDRDTPPELLRVQLNATRDLVQADAGKTVGSIDVRAWEQTEHIMLDHRQIEEPVHIVKYLVDFSEPNR